MKLEQKVTSEQISMRLRELGVNAESEFYWYDGRVVHISELDTIRISNKLFSCWKAFKKALAIPAYLVSELGVALPEEKMPFKYGDKWYTLPGDMGDTQADSYGKQIIYRIEHKMITAEEVNKRMNCEE
jgi:hypothetical protein